MFKQLSIMHSIYELNIFICILQTTPATSNTGLASNPCTAQNLGAGRIYFAISTDKTQFIECDLNGNANVLTCPAQLEWDQNRLSCVYKFQAGLTITTMNPNSGALGGMSNNS